MSKTSKAISAPGTLCYPKVGPTVFLTKLVLVRQTLTGGL